MNRQLILCKSQATTSWWNEWLMFRNDDPQFQQQQGRVFIHLDQLSVKLRFSSWWNSQIRQITDYNSCLLFSYYRSQTTFGAKSCFHRHLSFLLSTEGQVGFPAYITGHMTRGVCTQGDLNPAGESDSRREVCLQRGSASGEVGQTQYPPRTMGYGQQAGGTHPAGMHSCLLQSFKSICPFPCSGNVELQYKLSETY